MVVADFTDERLGIPSSLRVQDAKYIRLEEDVLAGKGKQFQLVRQHRAGLRPNALDDGGKINGLGALGIRRAEPRHRRTPEHRNHENDTCYQDANWHQRGESIEAAPLPCVPYTQTC